MKKKTLRISNFTNLARPLRIYMELVFWMIQKVDSKVSIESEKQYQDVVTIYSTTLQDLRAEYFLI